MLVVGGENLIDLISEESRDASIIYKPHLGGSPYNTALAAGLMGAEVGYLTPLSMDHFGEELSRSLQDAGVKQMGRRVEAPTSLAMVTLNEGSASYHFYRQGTAERLVTRESLRTHLNDASMIHIGSLALTGEVDGECWRELYALASTRGLFTSVDLNIRPLLIEDLANYRERLMSIMSTSNLIKLSDEDLSWWSHHQVISITEQIVSCEALLSAYQPDILLLTRGAEGVIMWVKSADHTNDGYAYIRRVLRAHPLLKFGDTVGAGDTFMGSFLQQYQSLRANRELSETYSRLDVDEVEEACLVASIAASINCERSGCHPPTLAEVKERRRSDAH